MTPLEGTSASPSHGDRKGDRGPRAVVVVLALVVLALTVAVAWRILLGAAIHGARAPDAPMTAASTSPRPEGGRPYVPATQLDVSRAKLSAGPDGNARVELVLRDVGRTEELAAKLRQGGDPKSPTLFLDVATGTSAVGLLGISFAGTGSPGETAIRIDLGTPATHVTVIDLRFGGRWEGLELDATPASWK